jgi:malate dehydrogenase (oxaloacetate-decarboxylating)
MDIPIFHDDQHGTAIVVTAAMINSLKLVNKRPEDVTVVVTGTGAAGSSIIRMLKEWNIKEIYAFASKGIITKANAGDNFVKQEIAEMTNTKQENLSLKDALAKADVYIGVSAPGIITEEMIAGMKDNAIVFPMANPEPEIHYEVAKRAGARIVGTGRSDFPNQVNNVLAFPGLFKGALKVRASKITSEMKMAAAQGLASLISETELNEEFVIPRPFDPKVADVVAKAVADKAIEQGLARVNL